MLVSVSPRRLALLALLAFTTAVFYLRSTLHNGPRPKSYIPAFPFRRNSNSTTVQSHRGVGVPPSDQDVLSNENTMQILSSPPEASPLPHESHEQVQSRIHSLRTKWAPPAVPHWPPYDRYGSADFDPNLWESFDWDNNLYTRNGVRKLIKGNPESTKLEPYLPYPEYNSVEWKGAWKGEYVPCKGARGQLLNESSEDWVMAFTSVPEGFPEPAVGDAGVTGIDVGHCFDRYNRFGPYGYGDKGADRVDGWKRPLQTPEWSTLDWGSLQDQCLLSNQDRYQPNAHEHTALQSTKDLRHRAGKLYEDDRVKGFHPRYKHRTALLIRSWQGYKYTDNDLQAIRALITELSLLSGGEYQVFLFINVKGRTDLSHEMERQHFLDNNVPHEFHSISILWSEKTLEDSYPKIGDWQVYWHQFMPLQWFSQRHPQFEYVWNWETDARYTGNHYHFLEQVAHFAKAVPRKYMWERNQRFYFPAAHGSYSQWLADTYASIEAGIKEGSLNPVWGPQPFNTTLQAPLGPIPPAPQEEDNFDWGVGEDADLITLQPIWDPTHTKWVYRDKIFNFLPGIRPQFSAKDPLDRGFTHPEFVNIPRRTYINTVSRFSKRQLRAMHVENQAGRTMQAEMWPATVALHHGLKAVYAPHPIWTDRKWPGWYMDAIFNADGGEHGRWGARNDSVYSWDREHNFAGWSWYYASKFPRTLYHRWLGWNTSVGSEQQFPTNPLRTLGGWEYEDKGIKLESVSEPADVIRDAKEEEIVGGHGRMCLPPMLLHPVKRVSEEQA